jgi:hypothetical protein
VAGADFISGLLSDENAVRPRIVAHEQSAHAGLAGKRASAVPDPRVGRLIVPLAKTQEKA